MTRAGLTSGPRTAVIWAALRAELDRRAGETLSVVDVGGGTGGFAVPLVQAGHQVTVIDASPDALASLGRRAAETGVADLIHGVQGDGDQLSALVGPHEADLVLCHSVLEEVDDPDQVVTSIAGVLRPGGAASIVVANRCGAVLARALAGHVTAAAEMLGARPAGASAGKSQRRFDTESITRLVGGAGLVVESVHGVRVISDLVPGPLADDPQALLRFELEAAGKPPFRDIATQLHLLARRAD